MKQFVATLGIISFCAASATALPLLQLDIQGGTYVGGTDQTTYANANPFTLYALAAPGQPGWTGIGNTYAISAAITPQTGFPGPNFGSFTIGSTTFSSANMTYGTPPMDSVFDNIPGHGFYPTYFAEVVFQFSASDLLTEYNVQDQPLINPESQFNSIGTMLYHAFNINVSGLAEGYSVHFDLYDPLNKKTIFAPFSHDAQSGNNVPEGGSTLLLLGGGLFGLRLLQQRLKKA